MKIVHINKDQKEDQVKELAKALGEKWARRDKKNAPKIIERLKARLASKSA